MTAASDLSFSRGSRFAKKRTEATIFVLNFTSNLCFRRNSVLATKTKNRIQDKIAMTQFMIMKRISILIILAFLSGSFSACFTLQPPDKQMKTVQQPLPQTNTISERVDKTKGAVQYEKTLISNKIRCISADSDNVWIATEQGVSRYIRKMDSWVSYTRADGLVDDAVNAVAIDGNLVWFATDEGVSQYNLQTNQWRIFKRQDGLASERVSSIAVDGNYVWFGTENGLNRYDKTIDSWAVRSKKDGLISNNIKTIAVEAEYIWVGAGIDKRRGDDDFRFRDFRDKKKPTGGVSRYQRSTDSWNNYSKTDGLIGEEVTTIAVGEDTVWFGTYNSGVSSYSKTDQTFIGTYTKTDLLVSNKTRSIVVDGSSVWFGTANGGVQRYIKSVNTWVRYTREDGLADDHVTWIHVSGNEVWFGTYQSGVSKFDKVSGKWTIYAMADQLADNDVRSIAVDETGQLWIGTAEGLSKYNPTNAEWSNYDKKDGLASNYISAICFDRNSLLGGKTKITVESGKVWVGTNRGLGEMLPDKKWRFYDENDGLKAESVTSISSQKEILWIGTSGGIFRFDKANRRLESFAGKDGLPNTLITAIVASERYIWAGTKSGLWRYEPKSKEAIVYNVKDGLLNDAINTILSIQLRLLKASLIPEVTQNVAEASMEGSLLAVSDTTADERTAKSPSIDDQIWIGTESGLSRYDSQNNTWTTLTTDDGLPNENVRALFLDKQNGYLWIGTPTGLAGLDLKTNELNNFEKASDYDIRDLTLNGNSLWLCTTTGLVEYNPSEDKLQEYHAQASIKPLLEMGISNIEFDGDYIWFSNWEDSVNGCIIRFNRSTETWQRFTRSDILQDTKAESMTQIRYIQVDSDYAKNLGLSSLRIETNDDLRSYVWFATDLGALRYDKISDTWQHYTTADGLDSNDLGDIYVSKRNVWVTGTGGGNVNKFDKQTEKWSVIELSSDYPFDRVTSIAVDGDEVWLSMRSGVYKFNELTDDMMTYTTKDGLVTNGSEWISVDDKYIWLAAGGWGRRSNKGLSRYDKTSGKWESYSTTDVLMDEDINKIVVTQNDVWIVYDSWRDAGITRYNRKSDEWTDIKPKGDWGSAVTEISEDGDYVWLATEGNGVKRYHLASGTWTSFDERTGLLLNHISERGLAVDEKYVWVGTPRGLNRYDKQTESWAYFMKMDSLIGREVKALAVDDRYVWCGTDEGLSRYDKWYGAWENFRKKGGRQRVRTSRGSYSFWEPEEKESLADNNVSAIAVDNQYVWIGTRNGSNRYDKIADRWDKYTPENGLPHPDITSVAIAGNNVWMGTNAGIGKYPRTADDPNAWISYTSGTEIQAMAVSKEFAQTLISDEVWCISASKDAVWVGTRRGVSRYDISKDLWKTFTEEDGLASNEVSSIAIDGDNVWFGGDKGVTVYSESTRDWIVFTTDDGLPSNRVTCIAVNGEDVWFGTFDAGVSRYNKTNKTWKPLTKEDGLSHNGVLSIASDGDNVWIGTQRGLSRYNKHTDTWTAYTEHHGSEDI